MEAKLNSSKFLFYFFGGYLFLIVALIFFSSSADISGGGSLEDIIPSFEEGMAHTEKKNEEKAKKEPLWDVPNHIAAPILIMASILDIVIILLWARNENRKREAQEAGIIPVKKRWTDSKWFWNFIALGVVQPNNGRIVVNWRNLIAAVILLTVLKFAILDQL
ncbi:hypothetical protein FZC76_12665 [Sutcliffiella horikoshii]|uniref:Uncharacterized protein n=1 Tax=Sutcliffiella horikoshii TaxID=79883 RepID=A0A5D4SWU1_9BACI|nr:hypothetical protein [Sutcliffiella horikoshii]TYS67439.1 hypothetical protein FZC76_12665 [Sutcliffiella horikoshii]